MLLHDRVGDRQAEAGALADILRREERIEDPRLHVVRHAGAVVVDLENDRVAIGVVPRAHDERAAPVRGDHRLFGVDDQIQQDLLALVRVGEHLRQSRGQRLEDVDVAQALLVRAQGQRLAHDLVEVHHRARRVPLAREGEEVADDLRGAFGLAQDRFEAAPRLIVHAALRQALGPGQDRRERVVQLVRDTGNRLAERGELFRLQQLVIEVAGLVLEPLALADVAHERLDAQQAVWQPLGVRGHLDPHRRAIGASHPQQVVGDGAVAAEPLEKAFARLRIDEPVHVERPDIRRRRLGGEPEHQLQIGVGGERDRVQRGERADIDPFVHGLEQPRERFRRRGGGHDVRHQVRLRAQGSGYSLPPATCHPVGPAPSVSWCRTSARTSLRSAIGSSRGSRPIRACASRHARRLCRLLTSCREVPTAGGRRPRVPR